MGQVIQECHLKEEGDGVLVQNWKEHHYDSEMMRMKIDAIMNWIGIYFLDVPVVEGINHVVVQLNNQFGFYVTP